MGLCSFTLLIRVKLVKGLLKLLVDKDRRKGKDGDD